MKKAVQEIDIDLERLPGYMAPLIEEAERVRNAAYSYRRLYDALLSALRQKFANGPEGFAVLDEVLAQAEERVKKQEARDGKKLKKISMQIRRKMKGLRK